MGNNGSQNQNQVNIEELKCPTIVSLVSRINAIKKEVDGSKHIPPEIVMDLENWEKAVKIKELVSRVNAIGKNTDGSKLIPPEIVMELENLEVSRVNAIEKNDDGLKLIPPEIVTDLENLEDRATQVKPDLPNLPPPVYKTINVLRSNSASKSLQTFFHTFKQKLDEKNIKTEIVEHVSSSKSVVFVLCNFYTRLNADVKSVVNQIGTDQNNYVFLVVFGKKTIPTDAKLTELAKSFYGALYFQCDAEGNICECQNNEQSLSKIETFLSSTAIN